MYTLCCIGACVSLWQGAISLTSEARLLIERLTAPVSDGGGQNYDHPYTTSSGGGEGGGGGGGVYERFIYEARVIVDTLRLQLTDIFIYIHSIHDLSLKIFAEFMYQISSQNAGNGQNYDHLSPLPPDSLLATLFPALYRRLHPPSNTTPVPTVVIFGVSAPILLLELVVYTVLLFICVTLFAAVSEYRIRRRERREAQRQRQA